MIEAGRPPSSIPRGGVCEEGFRCRCGKERSRWRAELAGGGGRRAQAAADAPHIRCRVGLPPARPPSEKIVWLGLHADLNTPSPPQWQPVGHAAADAHRPRRRRSPQGRRLTVRGNLEPPEVAFIAEAHPRLRGGGLRTGRQPSTSLSTGDVFEAGELAVFTLPEPGGPEHAERGESSSAASATGGRRGWGGASPASRAPLRQRRRARAALHRIGASSGANPRAARPGF